MDWKDVLKLITSGLILLMMSAYAAIGMMVVHTNLLTNLYGV